MHVRTIRQAPFGTAAILWAGNRTHPVVRRILLPRAGRATEQAIRRIDPKATDASCAEIDALARSISAMLSGKRVRFSLGLLERIK